jgi:cytochrome bd-type quinol oxidase subunit 1
MDYCDQDWFQLTEQFLTVVDCVFAASYVVGIYIVITFTVSSNVSYFNLFVENRDN